MGLFDSNCSSLFFPMVCDVYYAIEDQDEYGGIQKVWQFDSSQPCSLYTDDNSGKDFSYEDSRFYKLETVLLGRMKSDIRKSSVGVYHPLSHILITNVRASNCANDVLFIETNDDYVATPTVFEIKSFEPYIGVFNSIEYYKAQLDRSDVQGLNDRVAC